MAKRGQKKTPVPQHSNKILEYFNLDTKSSVRRIVDNLIDTLEFRNESEIAASEIINNIISGLCETESRPPKHSGETVAQETVESWKNKYPWVTIIKDSDCHMRLVCN